MVDEIKRVDQKPNPCCNVEANLYVVGTKKVNGMMGGKPATGTATHKRCRECGCNHHELAADPIHFGVRGNSA